MTRCTKLIWTKVFCRKGKTTGLDHCCKVTALQNLGWVHNNMFLKLDAAASQNNGARHKIRIISYLSQSSPWFGIFLLRDILVQWLFSFLRLKPADIQSLLGHCVIQSSLHIYTLVLSCVLYLSEHLPYKSRWIGPFCQETLLHLPFVFTILIFDQKET